MRSVKDLIGKIGLNMIRTRRTRAIVISFAAVVVFVTTYLLILPALTLEKDEADKQAGISVSSEAVGEETIQDKEIAAENKAPVYKSGALSYDGKSFEIEASFDEKAKLPEDTQLEVKEIQKDSNRYADYYDRALETVKKDAKSEVSELAFARFYDISLSSDSAEIEPSDTVDVKISYDKGLAAKDADHIRILHFKEDANEKSVETKILNPDDIDVTIKNDKMMEAAFEADSFSVYAIVYTVDFSYGEDGKTYEFSIPGGGFTSLEYAVETLKMSDDTSSREDGAEYSHAEEFVSNIEKVEFSNPELIWAGKVKTDTTLGSLKEANNLSVEYSAGLTEDQIDEINAKTVRAGDWALISLKPFDTEETLTITMKNGDVYVVKVTDAQPAATDKSQFVAGNTFVIWSTSGNDGLPYALKTDGTTAQIDSGQIDSLGPEFQWTITPGTQDRYVFRPATDNTKALLLSGYHTEPANLVNSGGNPNLYLYPPYTDHKNQQDDGRSSDNPGWIVEGWNWTRLNLGWASHQFESHNQYCSNINITRQVNHPDMVALSPMNENGILAGDPASGNVTSTHYKNMTIDGYTIDDNNDANLDKARIYIPVEYSNGTATITLPSNDQLGSFSVSSADPNTHNITQASDKYQWVLHGWVNIATGEYYDVTNGPATATVSQSNLNVFYADWWAADYSYTIPEEQRADTVDTSSFVNIKMWDYNEMYNLNRSDVWKVDGDTRKYIPRDSIESEEWYIQNAQVFQFVDNTDPSNCWQYGTLGNTQDRGRYNQWSNYSTTGTLGIIGAQGQVPSTGVLESLFPTNPTPGSGVNYVGQGNYLFKYDENTKTYSYDSSANAAVYNQNDQRFYVSNTDKKYYRGPGYYESSVGGFFPLNDYGETLSYNNGTTNNWLGISIDMDFWLPDTPGSTNANLVTNTETGEKHPMRFEFNGDDDVWVLIDGKLALDIGGIHEAVGGYIDFTTGEIRNAKGNTYQLSEMGIGAGAHTLSFYYLEQGGNASNCKITFNIAPRWDEEPEHYGKANVTKTWSEDTPEEAKQALSFSLQTSDGTPVEGTTVGYAAGTEDASGTWHYTWDGLDPAQDYEIVEQADPRFHAESDHTTDVVEDCWAAASYHKDHAFGSTTILIGNDKKSSEGGKLLNGNGSPVNADVVDHVVMSPNPVDDAVKWTVEGYSTNNQHFYLKNASGKYLSITGGSVALVDDASNASWFYMSPSGDLNDAHSDYRLMINADDSIGVGTIVNSADETDANSPDRVHIYTYFDGVFSKKINYSYDNTFQTTEITVRKEWSDSDTVDHSGDTITIALYQYAIDSNGQVVAEEEYPITAPNTDTITGSGTITINDLPVAGVFEDQIVTYEYHVAEKHGKEGYIAQIDHPGGDYEHWMITNIAPDAQDKTTTVNLTKNWKHPDGTDAVSDHPNDVITFKLVQRAVESDFVPVTLRWVNNRSGVTEENYYIRKGSDFSFTASKTISFLLPHGVGITTTRGASDTDNWSTIAAGSRTFTISGINDAITINARLTFSNDEWGESASGGLIAQTWGHSVQTSDDLRTDINAVVASDEGKTPVDGYPTEYLYTLQKDSIEDGVFEEVAENWVASINSLPLYKKIDDGVYHSYYYMISEISVNGESVLPNSTTTTGQSDSFTVVIDQENMSITNTEKEKTTATADKKWLNADESATPPTGATVEFELYADGDATGKTVKLNGKKDVPENPSDIEETIETAGNSPDAYEIPAWTAYWDNLQKYAYNEDGSKNHEIVYTIREVPASIPEGYEADYGTDGDIAKEEAADGGTITNRQLSVPFEIIKVDAAGMIMPLEGALFELWKVDPITGEHLDENPVLPETSGEDHKTGPDGKALFTGLISGYYEVKETQIPAGYILKGEGVFYIKVENGTVYLQERNEDGAWRSSGGNEELVFAQASGDKPAFVKVGNTSGAELPFTGGAGTRIIYVMGAILLGLSVALLFVRRRRQLIGD